MIGKKALENQSSSNDMLLRQNTLLTTISVNLATVEMSLNTAIFPSLYSFSCLGVVESL